MVEVYRKAWGASEEIRKLVGDWPQDIDFVIVADEDCIDEADDLAMFLSHSHALHDFEDHWLSDGRRATLVGR